MDFWLEWPQKMVVWLSSAEERKGVKSCPYESQPNSLRSSVIVANAATFPKTARVRKRPEFIQLASAQHKTTVTGFLVVWCENCNKTARLGITASKKIGVK